MQVISSKFPWSVTVGTVFLLCEFCIRVGNLQPRFLLDENILKKSHRRIHFLHMTTWEHINHWILLMSDQWLWGDFHEFDSFFVVCTIWHYVNIKSCANQNVDIVDMPQPGQIRQYVRKLFKSSQSRKEVIHNFQKLCTTHLSTSNAISLDQPGSSLLFFHTSWPI